jgi:hypothetical protein
VFCVRGFPIFVFCFSPAAFTFFRVEVPVLQCYGRWVLYPPWGYFGFFLSERRLGGFGAPRLKSFGDKKSWKKKKVINTTPNKRHEHSLLRWPAGTKKKAGVEQEEAGRVRWVNA